MDLNDYLRVVRHRWWVVLAAVMATLGVAGFVTVRATPQYAAGVTFFVTAPSQGVTDAYQGGLFLQQRVKSYVDLLSSDRLAQNVAADPAIELTADEVRSRISARVEADTVLISATITDSDPRRALRLAEAISVQLVKLIQAVETPLGARDAPVRVEVVGGPQVDPDPVSPKPVRNLALAALLGLLIGAFLSVLLSLADNTLRNGEVLQEVVSAPLLGLIPFDPQASSTPLIVGDAAWSFRAEALRKLRTNLRFIDVEGSARVIAVTSALPGEGKSTLACNLAIALAEAGWQVLLVDADLRGPRVADYLGLPSGAGLTDVLIGAVEVEDVLHPWGDRPMLVLPGGSVPPNPSELLGSKAMADLLLSLRALTDIVIIDTPPLLAFTDGAVVAVQADGALLVARQGKTSDAQSAAAAQSLHAVKARVLGCVLNMAKVSQVEANRYRAYQRAPSVLASIDRVGPAEPADPTTEADAPRYDVDPQELSRTR